MTPGAIPISDRDDNKTAATLAVDPAGWVLLADPIWVFDLGDHRVVWANEAALRFWRARSLDELRARDMGSMSDLARARLGEYAERFAQGEAVEAIWTLFPRGDAETVQCRCRGVPLTDERIAMLVHVIARGDHLDDAGDVSDRRDELRQARDQLARAEARFRAFAEAGSDWLWESDAEHRFTYYSPSVFDHFAYSFDDVLGVTRRDLIGRIGAEPDTDETSEKWDRHVADLEAHRPFRDFEYAFRSGTGKLKHASISGDPVFDETGAFRGYRGIGRDITERVEGEGLMREVERERDVALTANAVSSQLIATMSHELRTPLNAILGFSEIMSREMLGPVGNENYTQYASDIFDSAHHLLDVVDDLLSLSRVDIGERALDIERFGADALFDDVVRMMQPLADARALRLECEMDETGLEIDADVRTIRQVLLNLISNAIKFSTDGGTITIGAGCTEDKGIALFVRDDGRGIDPEHLPFVFEPFRTADPHVARDSGGVGLGLWICKRIVEAHHGKIAIESAPGEGTTVTVRLPAGTCVAGSGETRQSVA